MTTEIESANSSADPAAIFASALSLWQVCQKHAANDAKLNLSESYNGMDQFMRELMRVANQFETWACMHVDFNETNDVWPYLLEDKFGEACLATLAPDSLGQFDDSDCLRVAMRLRSSNPTPDSGFREFRIQTLRSLIEDGDAVPFTADDEPFDDEFGHPYFGLYGVDKDGLLEHIADRKTYSEAVRLAEKLAPGVAFPNSPAFISRPAPGRN
jgi:hypothetical protein